MSRSRSKLNFNETWSMSVGGMVGGGIFSTLCVVVAIAGKWAWLSFTVAGLIALAAGYSYSKLATHYGEGGGAFTFLREINAKGFAGALSWLLIAGYVFTNAVYAFTFGQYLGHIVELGPWVPRAAAVAIMVLFIGLNLQGVGEAGKLEVLMVWFKLIVLVGLAAWGLARWNPPALSTGVPDGGVGAAFFGAASVFMAAADSLGVLVEAASLSFLFTFAVVCGLALREQIGSRLITGFGSVTAAAATLALVFRLSMTDPEALAFLTVLALFTFWGRKALLKRIR